MALVVLPRLFWPGVGMAVFTAIETGVVSPDVPALNTVAALPHPFVLQILKHDPVGASEDVQGHTAGGVDSVVSHSPLLRPNNTKRKGTKNRSHPIAEIEISKCSFK